jgi:hypothetical protein
VDHSGRNPHGDLLRRQIRDDHSARTDGSPVANCDSRDRDAAYAHENSLGKGYPALRPLSSVFR